VTYLQLSIAFLGRLTTYAATIRMKIMSNKAMFNMQMKLKGNFQEGSEGSDFRKHCGAEQTSVSLMLVNASVLQYRLNQCTASL
jgi:hypothetical protein